MASVKRKLVSETALAKTPTKRRKSDPEQSKIAKSKSSLKSESEQDGSTTKKAPTISILAKEQPAFPRGGAGLLTPLEKKQINAKASRDAAKEFGDAQDLFGEDGEGRDSSEDGGDISTKDTSTKQAKKSSKKKAQTVDKLLREQTTKIGGLTYKRIAVDSSILGQIISIGNRDVTVALPNNLVGYIPLTAVSKQFSNKLEKVLNQDDADKDKEEDNENDDDSIDLSQHFTTGQFVRVAVTSTVEEGQGNKVQSKRRLELTTEPATVNTGLSNASLIVGCVVQVAVLSVEDHGLVVDLALDQGDIRGFVPSAALPTGKSLVDFSIGAVLLCHVTSTGSNGKIIKLSANLNKAAVLKNAPSVDSFLPGALAEILITEVQEAGLAGKIIGMIDATADMVHSGSYQDKEGFMSKFKVGQKVRGRLIYNFILSETKKFGFSILPNLVALDEEITTTAQSGSETISTIIEQATITRVEPGLGIYLALGEGRIGFAHISRLADKKVESINEATGPFKLSTQHRIRIVDYNPLDGLYFVSLQQSTLDQPFLRVNDVKIGAVVKATIDKLLIGPSGIKGLILTLADGVTGLVPEMHLSDVVLQNPEKKFRAGLTVTARVLSTNIVRKQIRLTLKKTLVNSDVKIWSEISSIQVGDSTIGTLVKVDANGALVQFYGSVKGFLPVSEMSEAYIKDAREHFRTGQVVTVNAISVNAEAGRLTVSCRDNSGDATSEAVFATLHSGSLTNGTVFEKAQDDVLLRLEGSNVIARLTIDHVSDGSLRKRQAALAKIRVGQRLEKLLILNVQAKRRLVQLCNRASLIKAAEAGTFVKSFEEVQEGKVVTGFISNITEDGVFVGFAARISGLITKHNVPVDAEEQPDFNMTKLQPVTARILSVDYKGATPRFWLTMREDKVTKDSAKPVQKAAPVEFADLVDPVDPALTNEAEFEINKVTKARIVSVKDTQLNVELAKDVQGRVDVSEVFDKWEQIQDRKKPLRQFLPRTVIAVKVLGAHDTRNHRFLPLTHRVGKNTVYELTTKPSSIEDVDAKQLSLADIVIDSSWIGYVNNIADGCLWINISPSVRGRIRAVDVSDDLSLAADLEKNFPIGSALRVRVLSVDEPKGRLDLTARSGTLTNTLSLKDVTAGLILPGRITRISERQILVQLNESLVGAIDLVDLADDFNEADPSKYEKNEIVRVCVIRVDAPNKKISLSLRPSRVLSSAMRVTDPEVKSVKQLDVNDVYRGFIRNVDDKGIFVDLGQDVTVFVRVAHLSDAYLKEWKDQFQRDQLVRGKIISVDKFSGHVQMSLKESVLSSHYVPPIAFTDLKVGEIVTGKVAKAESFGVFIVVDNSENVRGLCHRSEIADKRIEDASKLFNVGDVVKAKVLKVDAGNRRVNFGMKASYFKDIHESDAEGDDESMAEVEDAQDSDASENLVHGGAELDEVDGKDDEDDASGSSDESNVEEAEDSDSEVEQSAAHAKSTVTGLKVGGFDWTGVSAPPQRQKRASSVEGDDNADKRKKRKKRAEIQVDRTGDLDAKGPQSVDDYERLLLGEPDSSLLWLQYMAFHLELGDVDEARRVGERALKSIGLGQDADKMNVWIALLNLENAYGDDESVETTFKRACEYHDAQEIHSRLTSILIQSGKYEKADDMFQRMTKKFTQDPKVWINYATFLFDKAGKPDKARELLSRALQILPKFTHFDLTLKFAQLEFKCEAGLAERGRTIFEGLISSFPKRIDLYSVLLDLELKVDDKEQVRGLFDRIFSSKLKPKQAKYFFKRWLAFEEEEGDEAKIEEVKARAATWIRTAGTS